VSLRDRGWLEQWVTRRVPLEQAKAELQRTAENITLIVEFAHP
jgi:hypothetical protein